MSTASVEQQEHESKGFGSQVPFESIDEPGCYVDNWDGHMLRIPENAISSDSSPGISISGKETLFVTKISGDPFIPISKARILAADHDLNVNF